MRKGLRWALITVGVAAAAIVVVIVVLIVGSGGKILTGGVPRGEIEFGAGPLTGFPVYPGSSQAVGKADVEVPDDMKRLTGTTSGPWRLYRTSDSPKEVLAWYDAAMKAEGKERNQPRDSGVVVYVTSDTRYIMYISGGDGGETNIVLSTATE